MWNIARYVVLLAIIIILVFDIYLYQKCKIHDFIYHVFKRQKRKVTYNHDANTLKNYLNIKEESIRDTTILNQSDTELL